MYSLDNISIFKYLKYIYLLIYLFFHTRSLEPTLLDHHYKYPIVVVINIIIIIIFLFLLYCMDIIG